MDVSKNIFTYFVMRGFRVHYLRIWIFLILGITAILFSQKTNAQSSFGVRAGANYSHITGVHERSEARIGGEIGVAAFFRLHTDFPIFLQTEVNYSNLGEKSRFNSIYGDEVEQRIFLDFVKFPVLLKWYPQEAETAIFLEGGPYFATLIHKKIDTFYFPTVADDSEYSSFDVGLQGGVGLSFNNKQWEITGRASLGFVNQIDNPAIKAKTLNAAMTVGISYYLNVTQQRFFRPRCKF